MKTVRSVLNDPRSRWSSLAHPRPTSAGGRSQETHVDSTINSQLDRRYELHFQTLLRPGRSWAFSCDAEGNVDMNVMTERSRNNYLFARALVGIDLDTPRVRVCSAIPSCAQTLLP